MKPVLLAALLLPSLGFAADPDKLTKLRENYLKAVERATAPLERSYIQELERLKGEYMRGSKLDEAVAVEQELKDPGGKSGAVRQRDAMIETLVAQPWRGRDGGLLSFAKDGSAKWGPDPSSWLVVSGEHGEEVVLFWKNLIGNYNILTLSEDGKTLKVTYKPTGKALDFTR